MSKSLTLKGAGILRVIETPIIIHNPATNNSIKYSAIWDTGATGSVITKKVSADLGLIPTGMSHVNTANGVAIQRTFTVDISFTNGAKAEGIAVTELDDLAGDSEVLIGMDLISLGDFSITNHNGKTCMSFRIPSAHEIDYVASPNFGVVKVTPAASVPQAKPNDKCPCGSGEKYKRCHGKR
ncbi:aspartyl protease family protein [Pedobacter agri]|uniref:Aspartyl protease family protein n=1 Tax=Pedobacter agri TaxID=454586 RepID=A0A9X3DI33_9SPHI|nr:aspartyl protease family protein [Pedobacter agri]MCX3266535.1 aspartyl protease family protein [Pedobacter agri]